MSVENAEKTDPETPRIQRRLPPGSPNGAGQFATAALAGIAAVEVIAGLTSIVELARVPARQAELASASVSFTDGWLGGLSLAYVGVFLIVVIAWMIWQHQAHANLSSLTSTRYSPTVVWLYLVPVLGLIIPYRGIGELARAGHDRPALRRMWWGSFLLSNLLGAMTLLVSDPVIERGLGLASSVVAVVAAILGMRVIALINVGLRARRALAGWPTGPDPLSSRAKLAWGLATGALTLVGAAGFGVLYPPLVESLEAEPRSSIDFAVGDCFNEVDDGFEVVSCTEPHYAEAYRIADHPDQSFFPGATRMADWAEPFCYNHFAGYTGVEYQNSDLEFGFLYPNEGSWNAGDREVICFVFNLSGEDLTESVGQALA